MKRKVSMLLVALCLLSSLANWGPVAEAAEPFEISNYSISGVLGVSDVYAVTLNMKWLAARSDDVIIVASTPPGSSYAPASTGVNGFAISPRGVSVGVGTLTTGTTFSAVLYFVKTGSSDQLIIHFSADGVEFDTPPIMVVKTAPDPAVPSSDPGPAVDTTKYRPVITVSADAELPIMTPDSTTLSIPLRNKGNYPAQRVQVEIGAADDAKTIVTASRMSMTASVSSLSTSETKSAVFNVRLAPSATSGIHPIVLKYTYQNAYGDSFSSQETAYIRVESQNAAPRLFVTGIDSLLQPGSETKVALAVQNGGTNPAKNIKVTLGGLSATGVSLRGDVDVKYIEKIDGSGEAAVEYNLFTASAVSDPTAMLQVKLEYTDVSGASYSETNSIFLPVENGGGSGKGVPRLIVGSYYCQPQVIKTGSQFALNLVLQNTHRSKAISNIKVTVASDDGVFLPVGSSNTMFIEGIAPSDLVSLTLMLTTKPDAENKTYSLRVNSEYEDSSGQAYTAQEVISIPVRQDPRLVVNDPMVQGEAMAGQMVPVGTEFYNMGKTILYNLMIRAEGPFQLEGGNYYVGNFNPGGSDSFSFAAIPLEPGEQIGEVVFAYEDAAGNQFEERHAFTLNVMPPFVPQDPGMDKPPESPKPSKWRYIGLGAGVLVLAGGGATFWLRRRRRKKLDLLHAEELTAAATAIVPEIEYVGFDEPTASLTPQAEPADTVKIDSEREQP